MLEELNNHLDRDYLISLTVFVFALLIYRAVSSMVHHTRTLACLHNDAQRYFAIPHTEWVNFKNNFILAPLFKTRHNRELQISSAINIGTLPTRFQSIFLVAIITANITLCVYGIPWHESEVEVLPILRNRTGTIAVTNLIPVILLSSPKNPFIKLLNISLDSMNIMHRNFARLAIIEAVAHTICWVIATGKKSKTEAR